MNTVRIQRKTKSNTQMIIAWLNLFTVFMKPFARREREARLSYFEELKAEEIKTRTQVSDMRKSKVANDVVLGDLKIEEQKLRLEILKAEARAKGIGAGDFAPPSEY